MVGGARWLLVISQGIVIGLQQWLQKKRRSEIAEVNKSNEKEEVLTVPIIMRLIEEEKIKVISKKMMRKKRTEKENWKILI